MFADSALRGRLLGDNLWWGRPAEMIELIRTYPKRVHFPAFLNLVRSAEKPVVLMGPRKVGKMILVRQVITRMLEGGVPPRTIFYAGLSNPALAALGLDKLMTQFMLLHRHPPETKVTVFFDKIHYVRDWPQTLLALAAKWPKAKFVATTGLAPQVLASGKDESVADLDEKFAFFPLPPLMFSEYLVLKKMEAGLIEFHPDPPPGSSGISAKDILGLNEEFLRYLNAGGFPDLVLPQGARGGDLVDRLTRSDLPGLAGVSDPRDLGRLFALLAEQTGAETTLDDLAAQVGIAKNTLRRYLDFLEASFMIHRLHRVDENAKPFERAVAFKVYLTSPSVRTALFGGAGPEDEVTARMAETALVGQFMHADALEMLRYARWRGGSVDLVSIDPEANRALFAIDLRWKEGPQGESSERALRHFAQTNGLPIAYVATRTKSEASQSDGVALHSVPISLWCYVIAKRNVEPALQAGRFSRLGLFAKTAG